MLKDKNAAVILAAGRGSRMGDLTADKPKCLLKLAGRTLLDWQLQALGQAGIEKILLVTGYAASCLAGNFATVQNPAWQSTNMLYSLNCARDFARDFFANGGERLLVSYADIVWSPEHARKLLKNKASIAIAYDLLWEKLWRLRFEDPLADAETFMEKDGHLLEIGGKTDDISRIQGQYMGLLSFDAKGWQILLDCSAELGEDLAKTDMTKFLRFLLAKKLDIGVTPVQGGWCESDNAHDIQIYEKALSSGNWSHDWRK